MGDVTKDTATGDRVGTLVALNALNAAASVELDNRSGVGMFLAAGTLEGTLTPEVSYDGGTTWSATYFVNALFKTPSVTLPLTNPNSAGQFSIQVQGGATHARVRVSSHTSGTADCTLRATVVFNGHPHGWIGMTPADGRLNFALNAQNVDANAPVAVYPFYHNGTTWDLVRGDVANGALVNLGANNDVTATGNVAHDAGDSGNPVKIGYKTVAHGATPTAVAADDRTDAYANREGLPFVIGGAPNVLTKNLNISDADGAQTDTDIIGAISAGTKYVVTWLAVTVDEDTTAGTQCRIGFGTANTPALDAAGVIMSHSGIAPGSGVVIGNGGGIIGVGGDGAELRVTCADPTGGNLDITVGYYTTSS